MQFVDAVVVLQRYLFDMLLYGSSFARLYEIIVISVFCELRPTIRLLSFIVLASKNGILFLLPCTSAMHKGI